jgi:hypothetical protein
MTETFITATDTRCDDQLLTYQYYYEQLHLVIESIDSHFVKTLKSHEQDFLTAYRGQMVKVERELKFLKAKQNELVGKLMGDDEITNLQTSI